MSIQSVPRTDPQEPGVILRDACHAGRSAPIEREPLQLELMVLGSSGGRKRKEAKRKQDSCSRRSARHEVSLSDTDTARAVFRRRDLPFVRLRGRRRREDASQRRVRGESADGGKAHVRFRVGRGPLAFAFALCLSGRSLWKSMPNVKEDALPEIPGTIPLILRWRERWFLVGAGRQM